MVNRSDGGFFYWLLRFYAFGLLCGLGALFMTAIGTYIYFAATLPALPDIATYHEVAATTTVMRAADGTPLAELASERREILSFDRFPPQLVHAFLAAEDRRFYDHQGLDYRGIVRALNANLRAGVVAQGGSTITQQVAKSFLSSERTIQRKIREAIVARRMETRFSKRDILTLYLNQIFLGHGSYGVAAAARRYFDKAVGDLDLGEMAMIAGLARAPSRFSPLTSLEAARARRDQVLAAMIAAGYLTDDEANRWRARPVVVRQRPDFFRMTSPYFTEHVRRDIARRYGDKKLLEGGLDIETAVVPWIDAAAQENVDFSLRKLDKRQGWRGPVARLAGAAADEFRRRIGERYGADPPAEGRLYLGLVESTTAAGAARVRVGKGIYTIPSAAMTWAVPYSTRDATNGKQLDSTVGVLRAGDVIWVKNAHQSRRRRFADWTYDAKSEVQWLPAYDENAPAKRRIARAAQTGRGQAGRAAAGADAARAGDDLQLRPRHRLRRRDGRRRRLRPLRVQPRVAGVPPAGLGLQADVLLAGDRQGLRLHVAAQRRAARRGRSDHGRGVDADQPQQHRRVPGVAGIRADLVEERAVGAAVQAGRRQGGRKVGAPPGYIDAHHPRPGAGAGGVVHARRRADARVLGVRQERRASSTRSTSGASAIATASSSRTTPRPAIRSASRRSGWTDWWRWRACASSRSSRRAPRT